MKTQIKNDLLVARKSRDSSTLTVLGVLLGEIERNEQGINLKFALTEQGIQSIVKKMISNIRESNGSELEIEILSKYLPQMLESTDIDTIISETIEMHNIDSMRGIRIIMKEFKTLYPNRYDGEYVSNRIKQMILKLQ